MVWGNTMSIIDMRLWHMWLHLWFMNYIYIFHRKYLTRIRTNTQLKGNQFRNVKSYFETPKIFLAVQDSWTGDLVTQWVSQTFDFSAFRAPKSCCRHVTFQTIDQKTTTATTSEAETEILRAIRTWWHSWVVLTKRETWIMIEGQGLTVRKWPWQHSQFLRCVVEQYMIIYRRNVNPHIQRLFVPCQKVKQSAKNQNSFAKHWAGSNYKLCISDQIIVGADVELSCSPATLRSLWQQRIVLKGSKIPQSLG